MKSVNLLLLLVVCFLTGCSSAPAILQGPASGVSAANTLVDEAKTLSRQGQYDQAKAKLERALRMDKNNPRIWFTLAQTHDDAGNVNQARQMALKALSLKPGAWLKMEIENFLKTL